MYKIGSDVEYILFDKKGKPISSIPFLKNYSKESPLKTSSGYQLLPDNVLVETGIPPASTSEEFLAFTRNSEELIRQHIPDYLEAKAVPSAIFSEDQLKDPEANTFGCSSDIDAYSLSENKPVNPKHNPGLRSAGGHIHFSYPDPNFMHTVFIIMFMDLHIGLPSLFLDTDRERSKMYGTPGRFRNKEYGGEYRTPSNFWTLKDEYVKWIFDTSILCIEKVIKEDLIISDEEGIQIASAITNADLNAAKRLMEKYGVEMPEKELIKQYVIK